MIQEETISDTTMFLAGASHFWQGWCIWSIVTNFLLLPLKAGCPLLSSSMDDKYMNATDTKGDSTCFNTKRHFSFMQYETTLLFHAIWLSSCPLWHRSNLLSGVGGGVGGGVSSSDVRADAAAVGPPRNAPMMWFVCAL